MSENNYTPAPWEAIPRQQNNSYFISGNVGIKVLGYDPVIATVELKEIIHHDGVLDEEGQNYENVYRLNPKANIEYLIHCVNTFDEREALIKEMGEALEEIVNLCGTTNLSSNYQMKDAVKGSLELAETVLTKYKSIIW